MNRDLENASDAEDDRATEKSDGLGADGTIPQTDEGVAVGYTGEASHFEPEEDDPDD